jgi:hypothetical protein
MNICPAKRSDRTGIAVRRNSYGLDTYSNFVFNIKQLIPAT